MRKRLIAAQAIRKDDALTCVDVVLGPYGGYDFRIGVLRMGDRDYYPGWWLACVAWESHP